jgi:two-component system, sporulation sensor kinase D
LPVLRRSVFFIISVFVLKIAPITGSFEIYSRKQRWKLFLLLFAAVIVGASLYYTNILVKKIADDELQRVSLWVEAIHARASLMKDTEEFYSEIQQEERKRVELLTMAYQRIFHQDEQDVDLTFYSQILTLNTTIPIIIVDKNDNVEFHRNLDQRFGQPEKFTGDLRDYFSIYPPMSFSFGEPYAVETQWIYYQDSRVFNELRNVLDDLIDSFFSEVVINTANVPVIITDSLKQNIIDYGNIDDFNPVDPGDVQRVISSMESKDQQLTIELPIYGTCHVFYANSFLLTQLRYYPLFQFIMIGIFLIVAYILFSMARNAEQNLVWVGMSKETAHQLGTPLSALIAWVELLKLKGVDEETITEISKDLDRLEKITERFSKVGSAPKLIPQDIIRNLQEVVEYMRKRTSRKVIYQINAPEEAVVAPLNSNLFEWVLENLFKNAIDAMEGEGKITINVEDQPKQVVIDVCDTGKGIPQSRFRTIFNPGFTSKKRGWGLGLSLSKRIIRNYHKGKLFVKSSVLNQGTVFRIILRK